MHLDARTVRSIVGGLDDDYVARITETGATEEELREAASRVLGSDVMPSVESYGSPRVRQLVRLLEHIALVEEEDELDAEVMD